MLTLETHAQHMEDWLIWQAIRRAEWPHPITYLDIGAGHPTELSNTYLFYKEGCRGVLVEPVVPLYDLLRQERPEDLVIGCGIGWNQDTTAIIKYNGWHGLKSYITDPQWKGSPNCFQINLYSINDIVSSYFQVTPPTFVSIDVPNHSFDVLQTLVLLDKCRRSPVICVETSFKTCDDVDAFMSSKKYHPVFRTEANTIYSDAV